MPVKSICGIYDKNESNGHKPIEIPKYATIINNTMEMKTVDFPDFACTSHEWKFFLLTDHSPLGEPLSSNKIVI